VLNDSAVARATLDRMARDYPVMLDGWGARHGVQ
jgi:hypothetical protein